MTDCLNSADVVIAMDSSGSIDYPNFDMMKTFVSDLVVELDIDQDTIRLGLVTFADSVQPRFDLTRYRTRDDIRAALANISYTTGTTNTADAISYVRTNLLNGSNGDRSSAPDLLIILTDGGSNNKMLTLDEAGLAKKAGIHVMAIGIGNWVDVYELNAMSSYPYSNNIITVNRFSDLTSIKLQLRNMICESETTNHNYQFIQLF